MTPTLPETFAVGALVGGAEAPLVGGLSRLQAAVTVVLPPPPPLLEPPELLSFPQAAKPAEPMTRATPKAAARCRDVDISLLDKCGRTSRPVISRGVLTVTQFVVKS